MSRYSELIHNRIKIKPITAYFMILLFASIVFTVFISQSTIMVDNNFTVNPGVEYTIPTIAGSEIIQSGRSINLEITSNAEIRVILVIESITTDSLLDVIFNDTVIDHIVISGKIAYKGHVSLEIITQAVEQVDIKLSIYGVPSQDYLINFIFAVGLMVSILFERIVKPRFDVKNAQLVQSSNEASWKQKIRFILYQELNSYLLFPIFIPFLLIRLYYYELNLLDIDQNHLSILLDVRFYAITTNFVRYLSLFTFLAIPIFYLIRVFGEDRGNYDHLMFLPFDYKLKILMNSMLISLMGFFPVFVIFSGYMYENYAIPTFDLNLISLIIMIIYSYIFLVVIIICYQIIHDLIQYRHLRYLLQIIFLGIIYAYFNNLRNILGLSSSRYQRYVNNSISVDISSIFEQFIFQSYIILLLELIIMIFLLSFIDRIKANSYYNRLVNKLNSQ